MCHNAVRAGFTPNQFYKMTMAEYCVMMGALIDNGPKGPLKGKAAQDRLKQLLEEREKKNGSDTT